jgi:hypothetical protein
MLLTQETGSIELISINRDSVLGTLQGKGQAKNRRREAEELDEVKINFGIIPLAIKIVYFKKLIQ